MKEKVSCVVAILANPQGLILLQQRDDTPGLPFAGYWSMPGGKVEDGETPDEAIHRELVEEIELHVPLKLWKVYKRPGPNLTVIVQYVYTGRITQEVHYLAVNEGQALRYVDSHEFSELPIAYGFDKLLEEFFARSQESLRAKLR
jgi:8-oxo-dGTP diphosphatase